MSMQKQGQVKFLWSCGKGVRKYLIISVICSACAVIFSFIAPQVMRIIIDSVLGEEPFSLPGIITGWIDNIGGRAVLTEHLFLCAAVGMVFTFLSAVFAGLYKYYVNRFGEGTVKKIRDVLYEHIAHLPYEWHVRISTGDILQRCTQDVNVIKQFLCNQVIEVIRVIFLMVFSLIVMFSMNVRLSLAALIFIPVILGYTMVFLGKISSRFMAADIAEGKLTTAVQENTTGVRVVRAFGREAYEMDKFDERNEHYTGLWVRLGNVMSVFWACGDIVTSVQVMTIIILGVWQCVHGSMTVGTFMAFITYNQMMIWPVRQLGRILSDMSKSGVSVTRIKSILDEKTEEEQPCDNLKPEIKGNIEFKHVSFSYEDVSVLKDVSFTVKAGQKIGILGNTGSGKSTIAHLLNRLYDVPENGGAVEIDGIDVRRIDRSYLRSQVNVVLQDTFLFSKTIRDNIAVSAPETPLTEIRRLARISSVDDAIMEFGEQYDTVVGERGVTLSGGQKQRVAIARALLNESPIIIFDDSMSAVDTETDAKIRKALSENKNNVTTIYISHRVTTLMDADKIIVLKDGHLAEQGSHDELLAQGGIYSHVYEMQSGVAAELEEIEQEEAALAAGAGAPEGVGAVPECGKNAVTKDNAAVAVITKGKGGM